MGRRASSSTHPAWIIAILLLIAAAVTAGWFFYGRASDPFPGMTSLDVPAYLENSGSLRDNSYKVAGTILNSIAWSPEVGRLFSIEIQSGSNSDILPILLPTKFSPVNIQKGQRFYFSVKVDEKGILKVQALRKQ